MAPGTPNADIRIGYARCSRLTQELRSRLDALAAHDIPRDKLVSEKISTRIRVRPRFEAARQIKTVEDIRSDLYIRTGKTPREEPQLGQHLPGPGRTREAAGPPRCRRPGPRRHRRGDNQHLIRRTPPRVPLGHTGRVTTQRLIGPFARILAVPLHRALADFDLTTGSVVWPGRTT